jgi:hypothetical protein
MRNWESLVQRDAMEWLLEELNPPIRYFALRWRLDKTESNKDIVKARQAIAHLEPIQKLIARQRLEGYWGSDARPHHGTEGYLMLLLWLGAPKNAAIVSAITAPTRRESEFEYVF